MGRSFEKSLAWQKRAKAALVAAANHINRASPRDRL